MYRHPGKTFAVSQVSGTARRAASVKGKMVIVILEDGVGVDLLHLSHSPGWGRYAKNCPQKHAVSKSMKVKIRPILSSDLREASLK